MASSSHSTTNNPTPVLLENKFGFKLRHNHHHHPPHPHHLLVHENGPKNSLHKVPIMHSYDSSVESSNRAKVFLKPIQSLERPIEFDGKNYHFSGLRPVPYRGPSITIYENIPSESISTPIHPHPHPHPHPHHHQQLMPQLMSTTAPFMHPNNAIYSSPSFSRYQYFGHPHHPHLPFAAATIDRPTIMNGFYNHNLFENMAASESTHFLPEETKSAVENHPQLTDKQRDALIKILESYYKLLHQFNIDFRRLINESKLRSEQKKNDTIIIEPIKSSSSTSTMLYSLPAKFGLRSRFYHGEREYLS